MQKKTISSSFSVTTVYDGQDGKDGKDGKDGENAPYDVIRYGRASSRSLNASGNPEGFDSTTGWRTVAPPPTANYPYVWEQIAHLDKDGHTVSTSYVCLTGEVGPRGLTGRMYYLAGKWAAESTYTRTDMLCPIVYYVATAGGKQVSWWYLNADSSTGNIPADNSSYWQPVQDFGVVLTDAIFVKEFAQFGSCIITGDWLISVHGTINGTAYGGSVESPDKYNGAAAYTYFDPNGFHYANKNSWQIGGSESVCEHGAFELTLTRGCRYTFRVTGQIASSGWTMNVRLKNVSTGEIIRLGSGTTSGTDMSFTSTTPTTKTLTATISAGPVGSSTWRLFQVRSGGSSSGYVTNFECNGVQCFIPNYAIDLRTGTSYQFKAYIRGTIYADAGEIGGFTIDSSRLYNSNWEAGIDISYDSKNVKIGKNAKGIFNSEDAIIRAENTKAKSQTTDTYNTALYLNASGASYNYAFYGKGNGVLNGLMFGFRIQTITCYTGNIPTFSEMNKIILQNGSFVLLHSTTKYSSGGHIYIGMPTLSAVRSSLGLHESGTSGCTPFAIEITIIDQTRGEHEVHLCHRTTHGSFSTWNTSELPWRMSEDNSYYDDGEENMLPMGRGDIIKALLVYDETSEDYSGKKLYYRSYLMINRK